MVCPKCLASKAKVIDTREKKGNYKYRRYKCRACGERFSTMEVVYEARAGTVPYAYAPKEVE